MWLFWISCLAAGASLTCAAWLALMVAGRHVMRWRVPAADAPDEVGATEPQAGLPASPFSGELWRLARPWLRLCGRGILPLLSWRLRTGLMRQAQGAAMAATWDMAAVAGLLACAGLAGSAMAMGLSLLLTGSPSRLPATLVWAIPGGGSAAAWLVWSHIRTLATRRRQAMLREFPFLLDLMTLCVEAGLNLHGALLQAAHFGPAGSLRQELRLAVNAMRTGHSRHQALDDLAARCDLPALAVWVAAVQQADRLGMSLAPLLRAQAAQERSERFLRAETLAMQAPVRLLFPLVTCMFPCSFLVICFPIATLLLQALQ